VNQATATPNRELTFRQAVQEALDEEMARDPAVFVYGEDVAFGIFRGTTGLLEKYGPLRVKNTPISEAALVGSAVGAAATGARPVVEVMYCDFMGIAFDQIMNQAGQMHYMFGGKITLPLTIRTTEGAGTKAAAQHSKTLHHLFAGLPGIKVVCPATPAEAKGLLKAAIRSPDPVIVFEQRMLYNLKGSVPDDPDFLIPIGPAAVLREGTDVTVVATQLMVHHALEVAERMKTSVEVVNLRTLYPIDMDTIAKSVTKTGRLVVADESVLSYGTHAEIVARVVERCFFELDAPPQRVGVKDVPIPFSPPLEAEVIPGAQDIRAAIEAIV